MATVFCSLHDETVDHLLVRCGINNIIWVELLPWKGLQACTPRLWCGSVLGGFSPEKMICRRSRRGFDFFVLMIAWAILKKMNFTVNKAWSVQQLRMTFRINALGGVR